MPTRKSIDPIKSAKVQQANTDYQTIPSSFHLRTPGVITLQLDSFANTTLKTLIHFNLLSFNNPSFKYLPASTFIFSSVLKTVWIKQNTKVNLTSARKNQTSTVEQTRAGTKVQHIPKKHLLALCDPKTYEWKQELQRKLQNRNQTYMVLPAKSKKFPKHLVAPITHHQYQHPPNVKTSDPKRW